MKSNLTRFARFASSLKPHYHYSIIANWLLTIDLSNYFNGIVLTEFKAHWPISSSFPVQCSSVQFSLVSFSFISAAPHNKNATIIIQY